MLIVTDWVQDFVPDAKQSMGLESLEMGPSGSVDTTSFFKPVNIVAENGQFYATIYACSTFNSSLQCQSVLMWLSSLKSTDVVHLTIQSLQLDVSLFALIDLMSGFASTDAKIIIHLDQIVSDGLAYFYLVADQIKKGSAGALYIPSYVEQRQQDMSSTWKAMHDFYTAVVDQAVVSGLLTQDEANRLHRGSHVIVANDRFN